MKKIIVCILAALCCLTVPFEGIAQQQPSPVKWLDYPQTMAGLLAPFKGKVVYMDIMASWCGACLNEVEKSKETADFFSKNGIVKLFISIDQPKDFERCLNLLTGRGAKGYFTTAKPAQDAQATPYTSELAKLLLKLQQGEKVGLTLPHYIIVDKTGKIAEYNAARPSDPEALKKQLEQYLK